MKYRITETEAYAPDYSYTEDYKTLQEARDRMLDMYHYVAIEGNPEAVEEADIIERSAWVRLTDGNEISWDIDEIEA